jgi:Flp pilus assembly protein TadG
MRAARCRKPVRGCSGNTAMEFALVAPVFLALVFGIVEYSRYLWMLQALQQAAVEGARCMAIPQSACASGGSYNATNTTSRIQQIGNQWGVSIPSGGVTLSANASCGGTTGFSKVTITSTFNSAVPQLVQLAAGGTSLTATACFPNTPS